MDTRTDEEKQAYAEAVIARCLAEERADMAADGRVAQGTQLYLLVVEHHGHSVPVPRLDGPFNSVEERATAARRVAFFNPEENVFLLDLREDGTSGVAPAGRVPGPA